MNKPEKISCRILVVDDESAVCKAIKLLLEFDGHKVETVDSGEAALVLFDQGPFDVVITDYSMWGMKGDQLAAIIKERKPTQPIIMATAFAADFNTPGRPSAKVDCIIHKPFSLSELREAIVKVLPEQVPAELKPPA
jgi:CheY-like chemotaxis protein